MRGSSWRNAWHSKIMLGSRCASTSRLSCSMIAEHSSHLETCFARHCRHSASNSACVHLMHVDVVNDAFPDLHVGTVVVKIRSLSNL